MVTVPKLVRLDAMGPNGEHVTIELDLRSGPGLVSAVVISIGDTETTVELSDLVSAIEIVDYLASKPADDMVSRRIAQHGDAP